MDEDSSISRGNDVSWQPIPRQRARQSTKWFSMTTNVCKRSQTFSNLSALDARKAAWWCPGGQRASRRRNCSSRRLQRWRQQHREARTAGQQGRSGAARRGCPQEGGGERASHGRGADPVWQGGCTEEEEGGGRAGREWRAWERCVLVCVCVLWDSIPSSRLSPSSLCAGDGCCCVLPPSTPYFLFPSSFFPFPPPPLCV